MFRDHLLHFVVACHVTSLSIRTVFEDDVLDQLYLCSSAIRSFILLLWTRWESFRRNVAGPFKSVLRPCASLQVWCFKPCTDFRPLINALCMRSSHLAESAPSWQGPPPTTDVGRQFQSINHDTRSPCRPSFLPMASAESSTRPLRKTHGILFVSKCWNVVNRCFVK